MKRGLSWGLLLGVLLGCRAEHGAPVPVPAPAPRKAPAASGSVSMSTAQPSVAPLPPTAATPQTTSAATSPLPPPAPPRASPNPTETPSPELAACLRRRLPRDYSPATHAQAQAGLDACLPKGKRELLNSGLHHFKFGRDTQNGLEVAVQVSCGDLCPDYTRVNIVYTDVKSPRECECLGGKADIGYWGGFLGCGPQQREHAAHLVAGHDFTVRTQGSALSVFGGVTGSILDSIGLVQASEVVSIDGRPVESAEQLTAMLTKLPHAPPRWIGAGSSRPGDADAPANRELHFIDAATLRRLNEDIQRAEQSRESNRAPCASSTVRADRFRGCTAPDAENGAQWASIAERIEQIAKTHPAAVGSPRATPASCRELDSLPGVVALEGNGRTLELRYINWLR